jgi:hypothetical protein
MARGGSIGTSGSSGANVTHNTSRRSENDDSQQYSRRIPTDNNYSNAGVADRKPSRDVMAGSSGFKEDRSRNGARGTFNDDDDDDDVNEDIQAFYKAKDELLKRRAATGS